MIDVENVRGVLLATGWMDVDQQGVDIFPYTYERWGQKTVYDSEFAMYWTGFSGGLFAAPLSAILAVRYKED